MAEKKPPILPILLLSATLALAACSSTAPSTGQSPAGVFVGFISESDCGEDHAAMLRSGKMGSTDRECVLKCVRLGAAFGFVDSKRRSFYQLDDQEKPRPFAGRKAKITGRLEGDTIYLQTIEATD